LIKNDENIDLCSKQAKEQMGKRIKSMKAELDELYELFKSKLEEEKIVWKQLG
jgi:hypothetical protein